MTTYTYDLSNDFINGINPTCLDRTIVEYEFPIILSAINTEYETDTVNIVFDGDLDNKDKEDLDEIISNHNPLTTCDPENSPLIGGTKIDFSLSNQSGLDYIYTKEKNWVIATSFVYEGSFNWIPQKFSVISSLKDEATGSVRCYDQTNNNEICNLEWTNIAKSISSTEEFYNIPDVPSIIEIQFKTSKKNYDARLYYVALY